MTNLTEILNMDVDSCVDQIERHRSRDKARSIWSTLATNVHMHCERYLICSFLLFLLFAGTYTHLKRSLMVPTLNDGALRRGANRKLFAVEPVLHAPTVAADTPEGVQKGTSSASLVASYPDSGWSFLVGAGSQLDVMTEMFAQARERADSTSISAGVQDANPQSHPETALSAAAPGQPSSPYLFPASSVLAIAANAVSTVDPVLYAGDQAYVATQIRFIDDIFVPTLARMSRALQDLKSMFRNFIVFAKAQLAEPLTISAYATVTGEGVLALTKEEGDIRVHNMLEAATARSNSLSEVFAEPEHDLPTAPVEKRDSFWSNKEYLLYGVADFVDVAVQSAGLLRMHELDLQRKKAVAAPSLPPIVTAQQQPEKSQGTRTRPASVWIQSLDPSVELFIAAKEERARREAKA